jgi:SAM-dependent methyltransferase
MSTAASIFDSASAAYEQQLHMGIALSGESAEYFVQGRVALLNRLVRVAIDGPVRMMLDFGCGVGNACGELLSSFSDSRLIGVDCSHDSLLEAERRYAGSQFAERIMWKSELTTVAPNSLDVVYSSGVFHHIPPDDRNAEIRKLYAVLRPGGLMAIFENNPWNPGTRWVMSRIPFDRDAICLRPIECANRLRSCGFEVLSTSYLFFFPRCLSALRRMERYLECIPLGAQYVVLARRPEK